jgi:hypothetical protein
MHQNKNHLTSIYNQKPERPAITIEEAQDAMRNKHERFAGMNYDEIDEQIRLDMIRLRGIANNSNQTAEQNIQDLPVKSQKKTITIFISHCP